MKLKFYILLVGVIVMCIALFNSKKLNIISLLLKPKNEIKASIQFLFENSSFYTINDFILPDSINYWLQIEDSIANVVLRAKNYEDALNSMSTDKNILAIKVKKQNWVESNLASIDIHEIPMKQVVDKAFLTKHVDSLTQIWKSSRFTKNVDLDLFRESILPFNRLVSPKLNRTTILSKTFYKTLSTFGGDTMTIDQIVDFFHKYIACFEVHPKGKVLTLPFMGFYSVVYLRGSTCGVHAEIEAEVLRGLGIPAQRMYTNKFAARNAKHVWIRVNTGVDTFCYTAFYEPLKIKLEEQCNSPQLASKLFLETWKINKNAPIFKDKTVHPSCHFIDAIDITNEYNPTTNVCLSTNDINSKTIYLCNFTPQGLTPIDVAILTNKKDRIFTFHKITTGFTYFPCIFDNDEMSPCYFPFFLDSLGQIKKIIPLDTKETITVFSKFQEPIDILRLMNENIGINFWGVRKKPFNDSIIIAKISETQLPYMNTIRTIVPPKNMFNEVKIIAREGMDINVGEIEFLTTIDEDNQLRIPTSLPILNAKDTIKKCNNLRVAFYKPDDNESRINLAFDKKFHTFYKGKIVSVKFEKPTIISEIHFCPRTPNNTIQIGDEYELFAFSKGWQSMGTKVARFNYLDFENVPSNTIYWLKNHSGGKQENCFYYKDGKQYFVNFDEFPY